MTKHWQMYVLIKHIIGASIWRLYETLEAISLAFTCQWFIIQNKEDLIAVENCSMLIELAERNARQTNTLKLAVIHLRVSSCQ